MPTRKTLSTQVTHPLIFVLSSPPFCFLPSFLLILFLPYSTFPTPPLLPFCPTQCCHPLLLMRRPTSARSIVPLTYPQCAESLWHSFSAHLLPYFSLTHALHSFSPDLAFSTCLLSFPLIQFLSCPRCQPFSPLFSSPFIPCRLHSSG
jgi:hypothetical protein